MFDLTRFIYSKHAMSAFVKFLNSKYAGVAELNTAWSTDKMTFDYNDISEAEFRRKRPVFRTGSKAMNKDLRGFERLLVMQYADTLIRVIRKHDKNHLVLGQRWGTLDSRVFPRLRHILPEFKRFDICAANLYPHPEPDSGRLVADFNYRGQLEWIEKLSEATERPVLIGEFGTAARDSGVPVRRWRPRTLDTDKQRGKSYMKMVYTYYSLPFTVGAHWFKWSNGYGFGDKTMQDPRSCGLVDDSNAPYEDIVESIQKTHKGISEAGRDGKFKIDRLPLHSKKR
jgi:agarase